MAGPVGVPNTYHMSDLLNTRTFSTLMYNRTPEVEYFYQVRRAPIPLPSVSDPPLFHADPDPGKWINPDP